MYSNLNVLKVLNTEQPLEDIMLPQLVAEHLEQAGGK
jgi:hypothetical protein